MISSKYNHSAFSLKIYILTDFATLISFNFNLETQSVKDFKIQDHLKKMIGFKLTDIIVQEKYPICMLIEQGCICYIANKKKNETLSNYSPQNLLVGLAQSTIISGQNTERSQRATEVSKSV